MNGSAPEKFEKWWQAVKLGGFMNDEIMPQHVREAFDIGALNEREACAAKAREFSAHYQEGSDAHNTFVILAEWIESRA